MAAETVQLAHRKHHWGETFTGTSAQLRSVGIAVDVAFPGEPGGPKRSMTATHDNGLRVEIKRAAAWQGPNLFEVRMPYRDARQIEAARRRARTSTFAPGVKLYRDAWRSDIYTGKASALVAAGLVRVEDLPGQTGRPAKSVTYLACGKQAVVGGQHNAGDVPGYRSIRLTGRDHYRIEVRVSEDECQAREREREQQDAADARANESARREVLAESGTAAAAVAGLASQSAAQPEVADMLRGLLVRAEQGQITGLLFVAAVATGKDQIGMAGDFAADPDYAKQAAAGGFATLTGWAAPGARRLDALNTTADARRACEAAPAGVRLAAMLKRLDFVRLDAAGPLAMAVEELQRKAIKKPEALRASSKLFRALDDIETARQALEEISSELRSMSGWGVRYMD